MGNEAHTRAEMRRQRREHLRQKFPTVARILIENRDFARLFLASAPIIRKMIAEGVSPTPDLGLDNHDAMVAIVKDAHGLLTLTDSQFEHAVRLATAPECRETMQ